jgi:hypothetical protein
MDIVYAVATRRVGTPAGGFGVVRHGSHWPADDPVVKANPDLFSADPRYGLAYSNEPDGYRDPVVETATAAPGERRSTRRAPESTPNAARRG